MPITVTSLLNNFITVKCIVFLNDKNANFKSNGCFKGRSRFAFGRGIMSDLRRRLPYYFADYKDGRSSTIIIHFK